jgi:L-seryl-tRNA(Ser) seleniumtransferase
LTITAAGNELTGSHRGWAYQGDIRGKIDGDRVEIRSSLPAEGTRLAYTFRGTAAGDLMSGTLELGEYGRGRWRAQRQVRQ